MNTLFLLKYLQVYLITFQSLAKLMYLRTQLKMTNNYNKK